ncbi:hypothetical protein BGW36DRAFT_464334 [Talaromyces proteolyticus]|uniref:Uncharacterized protein n=1 Tax=Talaromyces proteolyticus TaxID=1131652 RepID=A0AAD4PTE1_9EURO|nr:uncharacterized protein BGW36DRAFT_464334 [Talaromyces proteolyticus]KAH8693150.1 hypothetical protein BGW36DRAFT_464334 [Talaromyces proteolyticus]
MGLPMYREASSAAPKSTLKRDPSAHARSSIRRRGAVRHVFPSFSPTTSSRSSGSLRSSRPLPEDSRNDLSQRQNLSSEETALLDAARGQRLLRDALRHGQPGRRLRIPRESSLRFEIPNPPFSVNEFLSRTSSNDDANRRLPPDGIPFTRRFAPAFAFQPNTSGQPQGESDVQSFPYSRSGTPGGETTSDNSARRSRPTSNRLTNEGNDRLSTQRSAIDGLGDRQRSASPDDIQDDAWETLLTTITPDANLPSTDSSFASTAASASANPNGNPDSTQVSRSSQSQSMPSGPAAATVHMILEPYPEFLNPCDFPDDTTGSDTEAESDFDLRAAELRYRHPPRSRMPVHTPAIGSTQDSQPPVPRLDQTAMQTSVSSLFDQNPTLEVNLQVIIDRLVHREEVPDEWWTGVGLSREIGLRFTEFINDAHTRVTEARTRASDQT